MIDDSRLPPAATHAADATLRRLDLRELGFAKDRLRRAEAALAQMHRRRAPWHAVHLCAQSVTAARDEAMRLRCQVAGVPADARQAELTSMSHRVIELRRLDP